MDKDSHKRYLHQANWTRDLRKYIFNKVGLTESSRALEVGCGTGAILSQIDFPVFGLDIQLASVKEAKIHTQNKYPLICADAFSLPYANNSFEIVFCHFLLLWLPNPQDAIKEMMRVAMPNGHIIAFAEPDYSERVDKPAELAKLGKWQSDALRARGANPDMGGELAELCYGAGIKIIETGSLSKATRKASAEECANEWDTLKSDLTGVLPEASIQKLKEFDAEARARGERVLYVPTHYIWGKNKV